MAFETMPGRLDPRFATDAFAARIDGLVFASLVRVGADAGVLPYLAKSWRWEGPLTCVFELAEGFAFADGVPVRAADVAATYASVLAAGSGSPRRAPLASVEEVTAEGDSRVRVRLREADAAFLEGATLGILPAAQATGVPPRDAELLASGPYRLVAIEPNRGLTLEPNPGFASAGVPIRRIDVRVVPDSLTRVLELRGGTVDLVQSAIDPDTVAWLERNEPKLTVTHSSSSNLQYLGMNLRQPPLDDRRVRRALAYAIDRPNIVAHLLAGQGRVADSFFPPEHWAHAMKLRRYEKNTDKALRLLDRAGYADPDGDGPRPRMTLSYKTTTDELARRLAEALGAELAAVGVATEIRSYDWATFFSDIRRGEFQLYSLQWVGIGDPDLLRQILHSDMTPPYGNNRGGYADARVDRLSDTARRELDADARKKSYARVERRVSRSLPFIPLWWPERVVVTSERVSGFHAHPGGELFGLLQARLAPRARR